MQNDYYEYQLSKKDIARIVFLSAGISWMLGYLFYDIAWGLFFAPLSWGVLIRLKKDTQKRKIQRQLSTEFYDVLRTLEVGLVSGNSLEHAFVDAQKEIGEIYGESSYTFRELAGINASVSMNEAIEEVFGDFANRSHVEEIITFSEVLRFAKRSGGNLVEIIQSASARIQQVWETEREIEILVASRRYEQDIMSILPLVILLYLKFSFREYMAVLYGNLLGAVFMTMCMIAYFVALVLGKKLLDIRV